MATAFKLGDTVRLKSGGPVMAVDSKELGTNRFICIRFDGLIPRKQEFSPESLEAAMPDSPAASPSP